MILLATLITLKGGLTMSKDMISKILFRAKHLATNFARSGSNGKIGGACSLAVRHELLWSVKPLATGVTFYFLFPMRGHVNL